MNKVINWFCGSFIRTIGRFFAFICIGMLVATLIQKTGFKFDISDLFGIQRVSAATFTQQVKNSGTVYLNPVTSNDFTINDDYLIKSFSYSNNLQTFSFFPGQASSDVMKAHDYFQLNYILSNASGNSVRESSEIDIPVCSTWVCIDTSNNSQNLMNCACQSYSSSSSWIDDYEPIQPTELNALNLSARVWFNSGWYVTCNIQDNNIICPTNKHDIYKVDLIVSNPNQNGNNVNLYIPRLYTLLDDVDVTSAINSQTQTQHQDSQNTQNVIQSTTNQTIENQNANTDKTIDSQKICNTINKSYIYEDNKYINSSGNVSSSPNFGITDFINIYNSSIEVLITQSNNDVSYCFYDIDKLKIQCYSNSSLSGILSVPNNAYYVRFSIHKATDKPQLKICKNGNQAMADTLTDESSPDISGLDNQTIAGWLPAGPVDSLLNLPLTLFNSLTNAMGGSCADLVVPLPFINQNLNIPCMGGIYTSMGFGSFFNWIGVIASAFILFSYLLKLYKWVDDTLTFRENNHLDNWGGV